MSETGIQAVGFLGMALFILSYQLRSNRALFLCQLMGCTVFFVQFLLLGAYTGAISLLVNIARNLFLLKAGDWKWVRGWAVPAALLLVLTGMTAYTWAGWISLLPFAAAAVTTLGYWTDNARIIRGSQLFGSPCTLVYDLLVHAWGGAVNEGIAVISILISIRRFGWKRLGEESP